MPRRSLATRSHARDEEETATPSRSSRRSRDDTNEDTESRPRGRSKDRGGSKREKVTRSTTAGRGWDARKKTKATSGKFDDADKFSVDELDTKYLFKILDPEPYCFDQHWIQEFKGERRKMSFVCLGDDCPLCEMVPPYPVKDYEFWNVADLSGAEPVVKYWEASSSPSQAIDARIRELEELKPPKGPDDEDVYFVAYKIRGKGNSKVNTYHVDRIKARDLEEEFDGLKPLTSDELDVLDEQLFDPEELITLSTREELKGIAEEIDALDD